MERSINQGVTPKSRPKGPGKTFGDLIDLHVSDMQEVGKPPRRSKAAVMEALKLSLGGVKIRQLDRARMLDMPEETSVASATISM